ncbi:unnamed protein product [Ambrosiozyma monospora]|uniref:Unnamed protein product n=1 Tax=Ambrosiozyma monospora TaxID=43982 RepID=A0ACB5T1C6_AMBMO|nr:unnamed protein product [Ambrosiozyma monospora]
MCLLIQKNPIEPEVSVEPVEPVDPEVSVEPVDPVEPELVSVEPVEPVDEFEPDDESVEEPVALESEEEFEELLELSLEVLPPELDALASLLLLDDESLLKAFRKLKDELKDDSPVATALGNVFGIGRDRVEVEKATMKSTDVLIFMM